MARDIGEPQSAAAVLMIRPAEFYANSQTAPDNAFQGSLDCYTADELLVHAREESDLLARTLSAAGVTVCVIDAIEGAGTPDACFPNNWLSTHCDGRVVLYPMLAPNRRRERRNDVIDALATRFGYLSRETVDLSGLEAEGAFIEGTGSLVLDRAARTAYVCRSARSKPAGIAAAAAALGVTTVVFGATDANGAPLYHTNVMLALGTRYSLVCLEALTDPNERAELRRRLCERGEIIELSRAQIAEFAGNALELRAADGTRLLAMSARARQSLKPAQRAALARHARIIAVPIPVIETVGGGSVRCMLAEIFLPRRAALDAQQPR